MRGGQTVYAVAEERIVVGRMRYVREDYKGKCEKYLLYALEDSPDVWFPSWDVHETRQAAESALKR